MISIDTNVVVRLLVADDADQYERARRLFETEQLFIASSVLLETEWVLRDRYELAKTSIIPALRNLLSLENVVSEDLSRALRALDWAEAGMDFADALHLAASAACSAFASFDRKLAKVSERLSAPPVRAP